MNNAWLEIFNVVTLITVLITITGAIVTITSPSTLSFKEFLDVEKWLLGLVGIGRGLASAHRVK